MSDDIEQVEVEVEVVEPTESEAKARRQGWRPKDEYRGPDEKWVDADAFLKRSDEELPVMRERLKKQDRDLTDLKTTVAKFAEHHAKVEKIAYERAMAEVKKERREALAIGDADGFEKAEEKLAELKEVKPGTVKQEAAAIAPEYQEFFDANPWFGTDKKLAKFAEGALDEIMADNPGWPLAKQLKAVEKEVKDTFPHKFANAKRSAPPAVEGTSSVASGGKGSKTFANLPAEAKQACEKFLKAGLIKSKDDYLKHYQWDN